MSDSKNSWKRLNSGSLDSKEMGILSIAEFVKQGMKTRLKSNIFYVLCFFKFQKINMQKNHVSIFLFSINFLLKEVKLCPFFELLRFSNDTDAEVVACSTFRNDLTSNKKNSTSFTRNRRSNAVHTSLSPQAKDRKVQHHPQGCVAAQLGGGSPHCREARWGFGALFISCIRNSSIN